MKSRPKIIYLVDISRVCFHARVEDGKALFVELPPGDEDYGKGLCGRLNVHMYGTRPAAEGLHNECANAMAELDFIVGSSSACVFYRPEGMILRLLDRKVSSTPWLQS